MINKHRIALALMASLGLIAFGARNASAKGNVQPSNQSLVHQTKVVNKANNDLKHLPKNLNQSQVKQVLLNVNKKLKKINLSDHQGPKVTKDSKINLAKATKKVGLSKPTVKSSKSSSVSHVNSKGNRKNQADRSSVNFKHDHHVNHQKANKRDHRGRKSTKRGEFKSRNLVPVDNNRQNIGGMNQFTSSRHHYLYRQIGGNTRDLGGYPVDHGKYQIASDRIIRSADLDGLSQVGVKVLKHLHVNKVIDLRYYTGKDGIQGHPDPSELRGKALKGTHIDYQLDPVYTHSEAHQLDKFMKTHNEHGEYYFYGKLSVSEPQAIKTYRKVFNDLLNNNSGAILFHCNLGRDRTGVTSALILSALGVNRNVIYHDYLLTYRYHYHFSASNPAYPKHAAELQYFFKTIDDKYGSVNSYLSNEIGLNQSKLMKLRKMYLVPNK